MRSFAHIRVKIFFRPDMECDREIWTIRDGSKLRQNLVSLQWTSRDLYGFVWHWFLHDIATRHVFINLASAVSKQKFSIPAGENLINVPDFLLEDDECQKEIFERLAGRMMGAGSKKGHPFTWIPKHLADARGRVSLRSFIIALREAARATPQAAPTSLTHEPIKKGVQQASLNRVEQLKEDYAWIDDVLRPLAGLQTPNAEDAFTERWKADETIEKIFAAQKASQEDYLVPVELQGATPIDTGIHSRLLESLLHIGVAGKRSDGRINIPDLFQVASGMLRKGGVPPIQ